MRRVVKLGGSLLLRPELLADIHGWLALQSQAENLVIVGGGELVDAVRRLDEIRPADPIDTHWQCVDLLQTTFEIAAAWFDWNLIRSAAELDSALQSGLSSQRPTLVAVKSFYDRSSSIQVPLGWETTSDTIAAILAAVVRADELVLLKSCVVEPDFDLAQLAHAGIVDTALLRMQTEQLSIRVEQLSDPSLFR
jgi:aspartokinase-like uncharacterized kinase